MENRRRKPQPNSRPVLFSRKITEWMRNTNSVGRTNENALGGGRPAWNGRK
ncbi:hypothetical protein [Aneurinibacillus thermoaerophilus]|uniref:hypothetical protein n=1 Tax=Aneurinibacillus thermoaerophilus TaxID=143495 RepID=UPI0015879564|nr:hypothetical protein [Aneurinibacillus thermoaerophilus]